MDQLADMVLCASAGIISRQKEHILGTSMAIAALFAKGKPLEDLFTKMDAAIDEAKSKLKGRAARTPVELKEEKRQRDMKKTMANLTKLQMFMGN